MASTNHISTPSVGLTHAIAEVFARLGDILTVAMESNPRLQRVQRLQAMSDEDLAARGLRREDIVRHVFRELV